MFDPEKSAAETNAGIRAEQQRLADEAGITVDELMERVITVMRSLRGRTSGVVHL